MEGVDRKNSTYNDRGPLLTIQPWSDRAACRDADDATLWTSDNKKKQEEAKGYCNTICPVRCWCAGWALYNEEPTGVWGGLDPTERKELLKD